MCTLQVFFRTLEAPAATFIVALYAQPAHTETFAMVIHPGCHWLLSFFPLMGMRHPATPGLMWSRFPPDKRLSWHVVKAHPEINGFVYTEVYY